MTQALRGFVSFFLKSTSKATWYGLYIYFLTKKQCFMALDMTGVSRIKKTSLVIAEIEEDAGVNSDTAVLKLEAPLYGVSSRNFVDEKGNPIKVDAEEVRVSQDDWEEFKKGYNDDDGSYEGQLKLDVSKPKGQMQADGTFKITQGARVWLVSVPFHKRGQALRSSRQTAMTEAMKAIFGSGAASTPSAPNTAPKQEPVKMEENIGG